MKRLRRFAISLLVLLVLWTGVLWVAGPKPVTIGPYVQNVAATSADVCFFSAEKTAVRVQLVGGEMRSSPAGESHRIRFDALRPDTKYSYQMAASDGSACAGTFRTAPLDPKSSFTFAVVGDSGKMPRWMKGHALGWGRIGGLFPDPPQFEVGQWIAAKKPTFFVHLGDVIYSHNQLPAYQEGFYRPFQDVLTQAPVFATLGNHDMHTWEHPEFFRIFHTPEPLDPEEGYRDYSHTFTWGAVRFLVIDAFWERWKEGSKRRKWLVDTLTRKSHPRTVVIMHSPVFTDEAGAEPSPILKERLWPLFVTHGVDLVLSGDSHNYQRFAPIDGVTQIIAGTGGKSIRPVDARRVAHHEERFGFLLVKVTGEKIEGEFWSDGAAPLDRFEVK